MPSKRTPDDDRSPKTTLYGIQTWIALPEAHEEIDPWFRQSNHKASCHFGQPKSEALRLTPALRQCFRSGSLVTGKPIAFPLT